MQYPKPIAQLIDSFMMLPGIGKKTAIRLAFYTLKMDKEDVSNFSDALLATKNNLKFCSICGNISESDICDICNDHSRDQSTIIVVEHPRDIMVFDEMNTYDGLYHVLGGVLSPMDGVGPDELNIKLLINRLKENSEVQEVIIATNATPDGESTAMYLSKLIKPAGIKVTRLAHGLSVGADIEYADEMTLQRAVSGRTEI